MLAADYLIVRLLNKKFDYGKTPVIRFAIECLGAGAIQIFCTGGNNFLLSQL